MKIEGMDKAESLREEARGLLKKYQDIAMECINTCIGKYYKLDIGYLCYAKIIDTYTCGENAIMVEYISISMAQGMLYIDPGEERPLSFLLSDILEEVEESEVIDFINNNIEATKKTLHDTNRRLV